MVTIRDNGYEMNCLERKLVLVLKRKTMVLKRIFNQHWAVDATSTPGAQSLIVWGCVDVDEHMLGHCYSIVNKHK